MSYADAGRGRERIAAISLAGLVQASIGVALLYGLTVQYGIRDPKKPLETYSIDIPKPPPPIPIPAKPIERVATTTDAMVPITLVPIPLTPSVPTLPPLPSMPDLSPTVIEPTPIPSPPAPDLTRGAAARGVIGDWFPKSEYPAAALRAEIGGRVGVTVTVLPSGRAGACAVTASSGNASLDEATCRLAMRNGRFEPARDANGARTTTRLALPMVRWRLDE